MQRTKALAIALNKKVISKVIYRFTELLNDRKADRTKTICPRFFNFGGLKTEDVKNRHTKRQTKEIAEKFI